MRRLGWVLFAATCSCSAIQVAMLAASDRPFFSYDTVVDQSFPLPTIGAIVGAAVGALIVSRYPHNRVGWLFCVGQLGTAIGLAASCYLLAVATGGVDEVLPTSLMGVVSQVFNALYAMAFLTLIFMVVPDGDLPSPRWRWAPYVPVAAVLLQAAVIVGIPTADFEPGATPVFGVHTVVLILLSDFALAVAVLLGAIAVWQRLRVAQGERRRQLLWIAVSAVALMVTYLLALVVGLFEVIKPWYVVVPWHASYLFVSVAVGVAILRYRLYDIDVILSRTIVLGVLVVFVTAGYIAVVVAIGSALTAIGESSSRGYWPSLLATALVSAAFQPVRRHVLRLADQLVYGNRSVPYEALATLSRRIADSPSPDALPARVAAATGVAVGAAQTVVELGQPGSGTPVLTAYWPDPNSDPAVGSGDDRAQRADGQTVSLAVRDLDEQIGTIDVIMPAGRPLRDFEQRLLEDVAAQAGVAFRNALLEAELAAQVGQIEAQSAELAASRRRLVGVENEAREQLAGAIHRGVVPHLAVVEAELASGASEIEMATLIDETQAALEALRSVCRGVFPALLERRGLGPALAAFLDLSRPFAVLEVDESAERRMDKAAEAAAYLFCVEVAPTDRPSLITLRIAGHRLIVTVEVPDAPLHESKLADTWQHARDRVAALDGVLRVRREPTGSVKARAMIPLGAQLDREPAMAAQTSSSRSGPNADLGT